MKPAEQDEFLYERFLAKGDEADLKMLLERHADGLTLFLYGFVHNMEDAEDLMLDAFATVAAGRSRFAGRSSFKTWLFSIGRKLALTHLRRRKIMTVPYEDTHADTLQDPDLTELGLMKEEQNLKLYQALDSIKSEYRDVLYLTYFEDMKVEEICRVMKKSRKQVYNLIERGRKALKGKLIDS